MENFDKSIEDFDLAIKLEPEYPETYYYRGKTNIINL